MTQATAPAQRARPSRLPSLVLFLKATELDTRMLGMIGALLLIWIALHVLSGGLFLTPRNLWNLSVQSSSVAIMAAGMVLVIVIRNIDLSVGSMLGFLGMIMGVVQADLLPKLLGFDNPATWAVTLAVGLVIGVLIGALQGYTLPISACRPSSSPLAASWSGAAAPGGSRAGKRSRRSISDSGSWAAGRKARSVRPGAGWLAFSAAPQSSAC